MTKYQENQATAIITAAAASAAAVSGLSAQIPLADSVILSGIEITMTIKLGEVFGKEISNSIAWSIVLSQIGTLSGRAITKTVTGWIPGVGNIVNATTAFGVVEALGWSIVDYFDFTQKNTNVQGGN